MAEEKKKKKRSFWKRLKKKVRRFLGLSRKRPASSGEAGEKTSAEPVRRRRLSVPEKGTPEYKAYSASDRESRLLRRRRNGNLSRGEIRRIEDSGERLWKTDPDFYKKKSPWILRFLRGFLNVLCFGAVCAGILGVVALGAMVTVIYSYTDPELLDKLGDQEIALSSTIYVQNGNGEYVEYVTLYSNEYRQWVSTYDIPDCVKKALIAVEDKRFYTHPGVDPITTLRAVLTYGIAKVTHSSTANIAGGSTVTQQLVKNITGDNQSNVERKIREALRALYLERIYSKEQILEYYLNTVYFNNNCYGIATAAQYYFDKSASDLTPVEAAAIIAITKSPSYYDPYKYPENNRERRIHILYEMYTQGYLTEEEYQEARNSDLVLRNRTAKTEETVNWSYATDAVFESVIEALMQKYELTRPLAINKLYTSGLKIYSTIDLEIQTIMENFFSDEANYEGMEGLKYEKEKVWMEKEILDKDGNVVANGYYIYPQVAMEVLDPRTGNVLGIIGGRGMKTGKLGLNRATDSVRQPGSSIKPLTVYGYALENNLIAPGSTVDDSPTDFNQAFDRTTGQKKFVEEIIPYFDPVTGKNTTKTVQMPVGVTWPVNFSNVYNGLINIHKALSFSYNTPSVRTLDQVGVARSYEFAKTMLGLHSLVDRDRDRAPLSVGALTYGVTLQEMTAAYTVYANKGVYTSPRCYTKVEDYLGNTVLEKDIESRVVFSEQTAYLMTSILLRVTQISRNGRAALVTGVETAGKTGTTSNFYDRWFIGYTPYYVAGIWWGYDENEPTNDAVTWQTYMWGSVMNAIHAQKGHTSGSFEQPEGLVKVTYCIDSGKLPCEYCALDPRGSRLTTTYFKEGTQPTETCDRHHALYICDVSGQIAHDNCPSAHLQVFVDYRRSFATKVQVDDSQYLCPRLTEDMVLTNDPIWPVYFFMYPEGQYPSIPVGASAKKRYPNCLCSSHTPYDDPHIFGSDVRRDPTPSDATG